MTDILKLTPMQTDALKEVGNIGAAHAASALSQIIEKTIMISVSKVTVISIEDIAKVVNGSDGEKIVIYMNMLGEVMGGIMLVFKKDEALAFADILKEYSVISYDGSRCQSHELDLSAWKELGGILTFSYLSAIGKMFNLSMIPSVPDLTEGKLNDVLVKVFEKFEKMFKAALCIETEFSESKKKINGYFLLIPDVKSLDKIFKALNVHGE